MSGTPARLVADAIASALAAARAGVAYGVPGGGSLDLVGALDEQGLRFVLTHGETAAALMASAGAEVTGRPGAVLVSRGPGAASVVNGVAHALLERAPLLVVTDGAPAADADRVPHQRLDHAALLGPVTKASVRIGADGAAALARAAVALARTPPAGPVHLDAVLDLPSDALDVPAAPAAGSVAAVEQALASATRPVVLVGVGARGAGAAVRELVAGLDVPVLATYRAKGVVPESGPHAAGLVTGATIEAPLLHAADAIVCVGLDAVELIPAGWPYAAPVVSLAPWPTRDAYLPLAAELVGPLAETLPLVRPLLAGARWERPGRAFREDALARLVAPAGTRISPHALVREARAAFPDAVATVDAGAHMLVAMPLWEVEAPGEALISSGLATMGYALPAAIGSALARPRRRVVCLTGDGGLTMCLGELETLARLGLPVTVVVFADAALSLIEAKQGPGQGGERAVRTRPVDFAAVASGFGLPAWRATDRASLANALAIAAATPGPSLVDALVDPASYPDVLRAIRG
ncbi:MAG: thiamine pyrophosphate-dependent enzyme [Thermoleophilia bacterium]